MPVCETCFHHCDIKEGGRGLCLARTCREGRVVPENYGVVTSLALDPVEKKPLYHFHPGEMVLSLGSYGCNLRCPFCQNYEISYSDLVPEVRRHARRMTPEEVAEAAEGCRDRGNLGAAFTYNEPLIGWEFVRDTARLVKERGMDTVLVTNGTAERPVLEELLPYIDAMNIDLKGYTEHFYRDLVKGSLSGVKAFLERAAEECHVEVTTLIIPGENDSPAEIRELAAYLAELGRRVKKDIPLHLTRFFPRFHMTDRGPTPVERVYALVEEAKRVLRYVHPGNV